jgi:hypothetical protein
MDGITRLIPDAQHLPEFELLTARTALLPDVSDEQKRRWEDDGGPPFD